MNSLNLTKTDRKLAVLVDPDEHNADELHQFIRDISSLSPDYLFIGGSLIINSSVAEAAKQIKAITKTPLILFPGHFTHLCSDVDGILLLSLISGRNADLLIGQHVLAASELKKLSFKLTSTGYMLIDGGRPTSVSYMSGTAPIPNDKESIAVSTAIAGEMLGLECIYMDAGSGAETSISNRMIKSVATAIDIPLIVGGGIGDEIAIENAWNNGANLVVVGNALEDKNGGIAKFTMAKTAR